jgi:hypothetical protein
VTFSFANRSGIDESTSIASRVNPLHYRLQDPETVTRRSPESDFGGRLRYARSGDQGTSGAVIGEEMIGRTTAARLASAGVRALVIKSGRISAGTTGFTNAREG